MTAFLVGLICGASIAFPIYAVLIGGAKEPPAPQAGPRLPRSMTSTLPTAGASGALMWYQPFLGEEG